VVAAVAAVVAEAVAMGPDEKLPKSSMMAGGTPDVETPKISADALAVVVGPAAKLPNESSAPVAVAVRAAAFRVAKLPNADAGEIGAAPKASVGTDNVSIDGLEANVPKPPSFFVADGPKPPPVEVSTDTFAGDAAADDAGPNAA
jgi:hypothetical protein